MIYLSEIENMFCDLKIYTANCLSLHQFSESIGNAIDAKDKSTYQHSQQVAVISYLLALAMGFKPKQADIIHIAGHLHDIGKIAVPDEVLKKKGIFTDEDWRWMKKHPEAGAAIVSSIKLFNSKGGVRDIILYHHERYDGRGYPNGLKGKEIPLGARIVAVADAFSAIIQDRPYRKGRSFEEAVEEIKKNSGTQFDPVIVSAFLEIKENIKAWLEGI
jgi:putative nucleotidyltransferase with HDIG domain